MRILATYNIKGGVGKTATAVNLAFLAAREGFRTLLWDLDPQGAASFYCRIKPRIEGGVKDLLRGDRELTEVVHATPYEGLDLVPADFSYRHMDIALADKKKPVRQLMKLLRPMQDRYHFLFIDSPPNITVVSENIFFAAEALLIPVIPTPLSLRTHVQLLRHFQQNPVPHLKLLPFFSMVDRRRALHRQIVEELPLQYPDMLRTEIPYSSQVELMGVREAPLTAFAPGGPVGQAYQALWDEIKARL